MASYNSLDVPLVHSWQCTLMLAGDYEQEARWRRSSSRDRQSSRSGWSQYGSSFGSDDENDERKQLEQDRRDFAQYFLPDWDLRTNTGAADLREVQSFLADHLNIAHWNLPTDNESIECALKDAVSSGLLVPVITREWRSGAGRASRPTPSPLRWPTGGGGGSLARSVPWFPPGTTSWQGEPVLSGPYDPACQASQLTAARSAFSASSDDGASSGDQGGDEGGGLLGMVETAAGAAFGADADTDETDTSDDQASVDSGDTSTPLGDAQPFEYTEDAVSGDAEELAASTNNENYAAKMLGYERKTFGDMIHAMKDYNKLRGDDNVIWHDNGDVSFNGGVIDNMHSWAP